MDWWQVMLCCTQPTILDSVQPTIVDHAQPTITETTQLEETMLEEEVHRLAHTRNRPTDCRWSNATCPAIRWFPTCV